MADVDIGHGDEQACIHVSGGVITKVSGGFTALTGYPAERALGLNLPDVLKTLLRLLPACADQLLAEEKARGYIFTIDSGVREIEMRICRLGSDSCDCIMTEIPGSRLDEKLAVVASLLEDESLNTVVYSAPELVVLKCNRGYRQFVGFLGYSGDTAGMSALAFSDNYPQLKEMLNVAAASSKLSHFDKIRCVGRDGTEMYRMYTFHPIVLEGRLKYILEVSVDVTRTVRTTELLKLREHELKLQNEKLEAILENMSDPLLIIDENGGFTTLNKSARRYFGDIGIPKKTGDIRMQGLFSLVNGDDIPHGQGPVARLLRGEAFSGCQIKTKLGDSPLYFDITGTPVFGETGEFVCGVLNFRDISDSYRHVHEMDEKNQLLSGIVENLHDAVVVFDGEGRITMLNARGREMYPGFDSNRTAETAHDDFVVCDLAGNTLEKDMLPSRRVLKGEYIRDEHYEIKYPSSSRFVEVNATPIFSKHGKLISAVVSNHDMTLAYADRQLIRAKNEELVEKNRILSRQAALLDLSNEAIFTWEIDGPIVYWNKGAENMYGYTSAEAVGCNNAKLLRPVFSGNSEELQAAIKSCGEWTGLLEHTTKDGRQLVIEARLQLIENEYGVPVILETNRDVTEHMKMEEELRDRELYFRLSSEASGAGVYTHDYRKNKAYFSPEYKKIHGLSADSEIVFDIDFVFASVHPEDREGMFKAIETANDTYGDGIYEYEYRIIRPDGEIRWIHAKGQSYFKTEEGSVIPYLSAGVIVDVTEGKLLNDKVRQISEELTNIIESTDDYIWAVGADGRIRVCNSAARNFFREFYDTEIFVGQLITEMVPPQMVRSFTDTISEQVYAGSVQFDLKTPIGGRITSYSLNPVYIDGQFYEVTVFGRDVTESRNAEREILRANTQLEERVAERTAQLEQSVADLKNITLVLSHDLKSALRGIGMYASDIAEKKDVVENAHKVKKLGGEILEMVNGLMKFEKSARLSLTREEVNLKKMTVAVFNELNSNEANNTGQLEFETGIPAVEADKELIRHVVLNILSNALKFTAPGRPPRVVVGCRAEGNAYVFYFRDNGIGFDMAYADKIFGVFERLHSKSEFEGSGVGLAIVRNIVQQHGGHVWVESEEGVGTTVFFSLPVKTEGDDHV
jgi:PAS domain S-box-containing protein